MKPTSPDSGVTPEQRTRIADAVQAARAFLPQQGPLDTFVAQNPVGFLESEPFEQAMVTAAKQLQAEPYLAETEYRDALACGRITAADIDAVLAAEHAVRPLDHVVCNGKLSLWSLHRILLLHPVCRESDAGARWALTERDLVERLRDDLPPDVRWHMLSDTLATPGGDENVAADPVFRSLDDAAAHAAVVDRTQPFGQPDDERLVSNELWHACIAAVAQAGTPLLPSRPPVRHRDLVCAVQPAIDTDALVHPLLIRWCAAFLDQGVARWPMPGRDRGLLEAVALSWSRGVWRGEEWAQGIPAALKATHGSTATDVVARELLRLGVPESDWHEFVRDTLLALRGWAGMIRQLEDRPELAQVVRLDARIIDFLALRLICDRVAAEWAAMKLRSPRARRQEPADERSLGGLWTELRDHYPPRRSPGTLARALLLHQVSQLAGLTPDDIRGLDDNELVRFEHAIASFDGLTRRRLLHLAYERRYRTTLLDALTVHGSIQPTPPPATPRVQAVFCMDERCESFRRHLEELGPAYETFGTAGFFGVPMAFRGIDDWHPVSLCPIVMKPVHSVVEVPAIGAERHSSARRGMARAVTLLRAVVTSASLSSVRGGLVATLFGALATIPLVARVLFPRLATRMFPRGSGMSGTRGGTRLLLERVADATAMDGLPPGFDVVTMAQCVRGLLVDIGISSRLARMVAIVGHGSTSSNNPHESAYHCGACGGRPGGANARALALMANDARVRRQLLQWGIAVPEHTHFIGGMLDTCTNELTWYDEPLVPESHVEDLRRLAATSRQVSAADAHERCRRFDSVPLDITPAAALAHVSSRAADMAQVRPELGHATNAVCLIGRRSRSRGLFLDRRSFLVSYDPTADGDRDILARTLAGVCPVASGINLAYYFSRVDRLRFGCGTKLPHNITGLLGVMDGHASDLRTGLPWQTVEIHEPVRLLVVVDAEPDDILAAADRTPAIRRLFDNRWMQLAAWSPSSGEVFVYDGRAFLPHACEFATLPVVDRSVAWYGGKRGNVGPAQVLAALAMPRRIRHARRAREGSATITQPNPAAG